MCVCIYIKLHKIKILQNLGSHDNCINDMNIDYSKVVMS
jgi:hypothetical protein